MFGLGTTASALSSCRAAARAANPFGLFVRHRTELAPRRVKYLKRHKGTIPIPTGGSTKGTTLAYGEWGVRIKENGVRLTGKQLTSCMELIKRKIKPIKDAKVFLRVFPDVPVCIKGNETRMGKGKGTFEFWATRVATGRVIFELGGGPIREEIARDIFRQVGNKLPAPMEFISRKSLPRLGLMTVRPDGHLISRHDPRPPQSESSLLAVPAPPATTAPSP